LDSTCKNGLETVLLTLFISIWWALHKFGEYSLGVHANWKVQEFFCTWLKYVWLFGFGWYLRI